MQDIVKAMEIEEKYIQSRLQDEDTPPLITLLQDAGFDTLENYFKCKNQHIFEHLDFSEVTTTDEDAFDDIANILSAEQPILLFEKHTVPFIYLGSDDYNREAVEKYNITTYEGGYLGGTIVGGAGDLSIGIFYPRSIDIRNKIILEKIVNILQKYNINALIDNNDILVNNKKVLGAATLETANYYGFVAYIGFNDNADLVIEICGEHDKKPGFLEGITAEQLMEELRQWLVLKP